MQTAKHSAELLTSLSKYDTPTICNAIELFDVRPRTAGYMDGCIHCCFPQLPPMVGYAVTAKFRASHSPDSGNVHQNILQQIAQINALGAPAILVFEDLDTPTVAATFGELMCSIYQACGGVGIITSGAGRDLDQVEAIGFPAFVGSVICSHGYSSIVQTGIDVQIGGITVGPGDLLHGDRNGVTTIPQEIAPQIPDVCAKVAEAEKIVLDYVKAGSITTAGLTEARNECQTLVRTFAKSLSSKPDSPKNS